MQKYLKDFTEVAEYIYLAHNQNKNISCVIGYIRKDLHITITTTYEKAKKIAKKLSIKNKVDFCACGFEKMPDTIKYCYFDYLINYN